MIERLLMLPLGITLLTTLASPASALDDEFTRATLKGLRGVHVVVEHFDEDQKRAGYDERTFQTDVELKLRMAGIKVLTEDEALAVPFSPHLYLNVSTLAKQPREVGPVAVKLQLKQGVQLIRDPSVHTLASTWSTDGIARADLPYARNVVKHAVDEFINAWLSVNPKK